MRHAALDETRSAAAPIALKLPRGVIPEYRAKQLLAPTGIPFPRGDFAESIEEAKAIAAGIGYPVVLKAQAAALSHKSDAGGVILNIGDSAALEAAWQRLYANVRSHDAAIRLDGVLVEAMGERGIELIVGARNDPDWGPILLVGFGGVTAELLRDVRLLPHDVPPEAIAAALRGLKQGQLLDGYRGSPPLDVEAMAEVIATLGRVLAGTPSIREIDLNPLVVYPQGTGVVALDALILND